ncbi:MAG TPA: glycosyltransferase, partial [Chthonomonadaceae bacterium]|nr:glycosyltransferase [Chthonomonadaceae bacterium]
FESLDLSGYDLVLSSSSCFAKGVITGPQTLHVCYTHAPMRFAWSAPAYLQKEKAGGMARGLLAPALHYLRAWDALASARVDRYIANSRAVARRIAKYYRRESEVVYPPVATSRFQIADEVGDYYMIVSRFAPYKRLDLAVEAFTALGRPLKIVGEGRQKQALQARAGKNVEFLGRVDDVALPGLLARAKAYIMPGEEDFGIAPVEANACGRPVIAYAAGGALDTQVDGVTGALFAEPTVAGLCEAVERADRIAFDPQAIRAHALRFDTSAFEASIRSLLARYLTDSHALVSAPSWSPVEEVAR